MANYDEDIKRIMDDVLKDGTIDKIFRERMVEAFDKAIVDSLKFGEAHKTINRRIDAMLITHIEKYDLTAYIPKLDAVLTEIVNSTALKENRDILNNFKELMCEPDKNAITTSELFKAYIDFVAKNIDTCGREIEYDDDGGVRYVPMDVYVDVEYLEDRAWSSFDKAVVKLYVGEDDHEELNREIVITRLKDCTSTNWHIEKLYHFDLMSLHNLTDFDILLIRLERAYASISIDNKEDQGIAELVQKPEATYK